MGLRMVLLTFLYLAVISCRQTEESKEVMSEALNIYLSSELADSIKTEKSLELTNRALELDNRNVSTLSHKTTLLFKKKDIEGLLKTVDHLIKARPEKPYYLVQKALYLELKGDSSRATEYYDSALIGYQKYLENDSLNFNLLLEYVGFLEAKGDTTSAKETLTRMWGSMNFDDSQKEILEAYRGQPFSKEVLVKYWNGEITYEQVEEEIDEK